MTGAVRLACGGDLDAAGRMLHDFNAEFGDPAPAPDWLAKRIEDLLAEGQTIVLLAGQGPDGLAVLRFRPSLWSDAEECYLAELYVVPPLRGRGLGRALMERALEAAKAKGADYMDLATGEGDVAARALYESLGFSNRDGKPDGPLNYCYERQL
jgi:ribosomal protein S18 acetylase RimI-like enzyme